MAYNCYLKRDIPENNIKESVGYILGQKGNAATDDEKSIMDMSGEELYDNANDLISDYFQKHKLEGGTCDFGGIAVLIEVNKTIDEDFIDWDVAFFGQATYGGPSLSQLCMLVFFGILLGTGAGFIIGMRYNKKFNKMVRQSTFGRRMTMTISDNDMLKKTLSLTDFEGLDLDELNDEYNESTPLNKS